MEKFHPFIIWQAFLYGYKAEIFAIKSLQAVRITEPADIQWVNLQVDDIVLEHAIIGSEVRTVKPFLYLRMRAKQDAQIKQDRTNGFQ